MNCQTPSFLYRETEKAFSNLAWETNRKITLYPCPREGGEAEAQLDTTVISYGNRYAPKVVIVSSGVHGVELFASSLIEREWMLMADQISRQPGSPLRFVFVHNLNPFGAAFDARNDERNIDVNRNFLPVFTCLPSDPPFFKELEPAFAPKDLSTAARIKSWAQLGLFTTKRSSRVLANTLLGGQYSNDQAPYFGGHAPSQTHTNWRAIVENHVFNEPIKQLFHFDLHAGSGPFGAMQLLAPQTSLSRYSERLSCNLAWQAGLARKGFAPTHGDIIDFWPYLAPVQTDVLPLTVEVGTSTLSGYDTLDAMIRRNTLFTRYRDAHPAADPIKEQMRRAFYPTDPQWHESVRVQSRTLFKTLERLTK